MSVQLQTFQGKSITGIVFDGTFDASIAIANFVKESKWGNSIDKFTIEHYNIGSRLGKTHLSFAVLPVKTDPNNRSNREFTLYVGDFLTLEGAGGFEVVRGTHLQTYYARLEE